MSTTTYAMQPAWFARAWLNVRKTAGQSEAYENYLLIEPHDTGLWVVAIADNVTMASWVPFKHEDIDSPPAWDEDPSAPPFLVGDGRNRVTALMKDLWGQMKKDPLEVGDDFRLTISFATEDGKQLTFAGTERRIVRFATPTEHVDTTIADLPVPPWRTLMNSIGTGERKGMEMAPDVFEALAAVEKGRPPQFRFGGGSAALVMFVPTTGALPTTWARVTVGKRTEDEEREVVAMNTQVYDTLAGRYDDDEQFDIDDDEPVPATSAAAATAGSVLAQLGIEAPAVN